MNEKLIVLILTLGLSAAGIAIGFWWLFVNPRRYRKGIEWSDTSPDYKPRYVLLTAALTGLLAVALLLLRVLGVKG